MISLPVSAHSVKCVKVCQGKKVFYRKPEKWKKQSLKQDLYFGFGSKTA